MGQAERRRTERETQIIPCVLRSQRGDAGVRIRNLSVGGVMVDGVAGLAVGEAVSLSLPNIGWVNAAVAWSLEDRAGLAFAVAVRPQSVLSKRRHAGRATVRFIRTQF